ncbi:hypothetical protein [Shimia aestuarii]|uniref:Invasion protein IalB, involved in pathogenesis n=1 Tax=Shimia aestuarii TaxID=254406 RepID=A0A1I4IIJ6_9RHOB|nr:hypothetical protein [Shimia aestuarii]SFL54128.1 hypothetical protein SAMN04488042_101621 [Shimia aestuarii]
MRLVTKIAIFTTAALCAAPAMAEKFLGYGAIEGWNVYVDTEKKSCMIETKDDFENVVQMGLTRDRGVAYIGVFTKAETDIRKGAKSAVAVLIGENLYVGEATGMRGNITKGYSGGYVLTDDPQVFDDIAKAYTMTVFPEKSYSFFVDLKGTAKALELAKKCNAEQVQ